MKMAIEKNTEFKMRRASDDRHFSERIETLKKQIDEGIATLFRGRKPESLYTPMFYLLEAGGKRIRPILLILSCSAVGGRPKDCLDAALAIELLHTFTLVHDDIMDHDDMRRGRPTVHKQWDEPAAILAGDGLVTLAYQTLLKINHPEIIQVQKTFTDGLLALCEGQALDKEFETRDDVLISEYEKMIEKKTGRLIEVSCEIGAILGNGTKEERENLKKFAALLGKAFQIQDDVLDVRSTEKITGKPMGSDLMEKKKTYLTIHFMGTGSALDKARFLRLWNKDSLQRRDVLKIKALFEEAGTFEAAQCTVEKFIAKALKHLETLPSSESREDLKRMAFKIRDRIC